MTPIVKSVSEHGSVRNIVGGIYYVPFDHGLGPRTPNDSVTVMWAP